MFESRFNGQYKPWRYNYIISYLELRKYKSNLQFYFYKKEDKEVKIDSFEYEIEGYFKFGSDKQKSLVSIGIKELQKKYPKFKKKYFDTEMFLITLEYCIDMNEDAI